MSIHQVADRLFSDIAREKYDVGVFASGYEARCTLVPKELEGGNIDISVVLGLKDLADTEPRRAHDEYFRSRWKEPEMARSGNDFVIQELLNNIVSKGSHVRRILVDCSSMSRLWRAF